MFNTSPETVMGFPVAEGYIKLPESSMPLVSFDVSLGQHYDNVEFNFEAYGDLHREMTDMNKTESMNGLTLSFLNGKRQRARFSPVTRMIEVTIPTKPHADKQRKLGSSIIHETQHAVDTRDYAESDPKNFGENCAIKGNISMLLVKASYVALVPSEIAYFGFSSSPNYMIGSLAAFGAGMAGERAFYTNSPREKRARYAQNAYSSSAFDLIKITEKSKTTPSSHTAPEEITV